MPTTHSITLEHERAALDEIDARIVAALAQRLRLVDRIGEAKRAGAVPLPVRDMEREREVLAQVRRLAKAHDLDERAIQTLQAVYEAILAMSVQRQANAPTCGCSRDGDAPINPYDLDLGDFARRPLRVVFRGGEGAYSELAAQRVMRRHELEARAEIAGVPSFHDAVDAVARGAADLAVLPVENTTTGPIHDALDLVADANLAIVGEVIVPVAHALIARPGADRHRITRVLSHPQALAQCVQFLRHELPHATPEPFVDTALTVHKLLDTRDETLAAIAGEHVAARNGLAVLARDIADREGNRTRFVVAAREVVCVPVDAACKTTLTFTLPHEAGALSRALGALSRHGANLTRIVSRPLAGKSWEYSFVTDLVATAASARAAIGALAGVATCCRVLGTYRADDDAIPQPSNPRGGTDVSSVSSQHHPHAQPTCVQPTGARPNHTSTTRADVSPALRADGTSAPLGPEPAWRLASRAVHPTDTVVQVPDDLVACAVRGVDPVAIGGAAPILIAGPCAVESRAQIVECARAIREAGGHALRGGCFKPRTSPYSFQGHGLRALAWLADAGREAGLPIVTEVLAVADIEAVAEHADVLQIGSRNMYHAPLLRAVGRTRRRVLLKRGLSATVEEWLLAAEYVLAEGNPNVILCERGIRTFETATRNTLDLTVIPWLRARTHLPIIVDPSHAAGERSLVAPLAKAAIAAGARGVMVETHPDPERSVSDAAQALSLTAFAELARTLGVGAREPITA